MGDHSRRGSAISHDTAIAAIAERQHGNVTRAQLLALGLTDNGISHRLKLARLHRVHPGVYSVGKPPVTPLERASAAVLACGPGAALSHASAMALWGFANRWPTTFDVVIPGDRRPKDIRAHRLRGLRHRDLTTQLGIRTTSPARTLLDCAPQQTEQTRARTVNDALRSPYLTRDALRELLARTRNHPGHPLLARFATRQDGPTRSDLEDAFLALCRRYNLPDPAINTRVGGYEVDAYFKAERLIVELDGWDFHSSKQAFENDRTRDVDALANGLTTVRITYDRLTKHPETEAARLKRILGARGS